MRTMSKSWAWSSFLSSSSNLKLAIKEHDNDKELLLIRLHGVIRGIKDLTTDKD